VQLLLLATFLVSDALNFMLDLSASLALLPYFLAAAYALKLALTGETYDDENGERAARRDAVVAGIATVYALFLFVAARLKFVLLACLILGPAALLYVKARSERGRRLFSVSEAALLVAIVAGAVIAVAGLWTGHITL